MSKRESRPKPVARRASQATCLETIYEGYTTNDVIRVQPVTGYKCQACPGIWIGSLACVNSHCGLKHKSQEGRLLTSTHQTDEYPVMVCEQCSGALHVAMQHLTATPQRGQLAACRPEIR